MQLIFDFSLGLISFILVLSLVVFVHEFGHYQVAKWLKVKIEKFSLGFGPELFAWNDKNGVRWRLGAYPLGGYVKFVGDHDASSYTSQAANADKSDSGLFHSKPVWVRALVTVAGPLYNFVFAIAIFAIMLLALGETIQQPIIQKIDEGSAAQKAGLVAGDTILSINEKEMESISDVQRTVVTAGGQNLRLVISRNNSNMAIDVTPQIVTRKTPFGDKQQQGALGIALGGTAKGVVRKSYNPLEATARATEKTYNIIDTQVRFVAALFRGGMSPGHLSGPIGIGQTAGLVAKNSIDGAGDSANSSEKLGALALGLVQLAAVLSISIGFMNLLPLPILDGGHLVFYAFEAIRGKPVPDNVQAASFKIGFFCLLALFAFATFQDLSRFGLFKPLQALTGAG